MRIVYYILFFLAINFRFGFAANDSSSIVNQKKWNESAKNYHYNENFKEIKQREINSPYSPYLSRIKKAIIWIIIIVLVIVLLILLSGIFKDLSLRVNEKTNLRYHEIENIETAELEKMLSQAIENNFFREAIRFKYLILLRSLNERKFINWKKDKTNGHYLAEMAGRSGFELFRLLTIQFEYYWYGEYSVKEDDYHNIIPLFDKMDKLMKSHE